MLSPEKYPDGGGVPISGTATLPTNRQEARRWRPERYSGIQRPKCSDEKRLRQKDEAALDRDHPNVLAGTGRG
jgi:hypothetical protein